MDNIVSIKRKAQKLVQQGSYDEAIEQYVLIVESGEMDPYDYVVLGDLLLRNNRREEAVNRYEEALSSYGEGGLHRNAIALAKRIKRLAPERYDIQRRLGDLYAAEGLSSESALHYLEYLERAKDDETFPDAAEEICARLLSFPLPSFELVPRIVGIAREVERAASLASSVMYQAERARDAGQAKVHESLMELATSLDPNVGATAAPAAEAPGYMDPGSITLDEPSAGEPGTIEFDDPSAINLDAPAETNDEDVPVLDLDEASESQNEPFEVEHTSDFVTQNEEPAVETSAVSEPGIIDLSDESDAGDTVDLGSSYSAPAPEAPPAAESKPAPTGDASEAQELKGKAEKSLMKGDHLVAQRYFVKAAEAYAALGHDQLAEDLYEQVVRLDPNHLEALQHLMDIAHANRNEVKIKRYGCELGDVLIARERYDEAKVQFERVLEVDPDNPKAASRVNRLNSMRGSDIASYDEVETPAVEEVATAETSAEPVEEQTQTKQELAAILDEFRAAVVGTIPQEDAQAHYDMGFAYREMDLVDEAVLEFEQAAENEEIRPRALEMLAECYLLRARGEEALTVLEEVLACAEEDHYKSRIHFAIGKAREAMGMFDEAEDSYFQALELNQDFLEAAERLNDISTKKAEEA
ncbi:MAG: hypothetical protein HKN21_08950 [Candidatus Eisenbacteria bacterium]|uniref:Tetratricopeptide repeat protein n=1 Tax=Eiseniibacteriota bacterium TaxID=2212470 RepID=A0A7Y2H2C8_UNCEI|nr:hypothetical protein [Candidatus Eisenbacteria bacterium]